MTSAGPNQVRLRHRYGDQLKNGGDSAINSPFNPILCRLQGSNHKTNHTTLIYMTYNATYHTINMSDAVLVYYSLNK